jgi:hypothetical protein
VEHGLYPLWVFGSISRRDIWHIQSPPQSREDDWPDQAYLWSKSCCSTTLLRLSPRKPSYRMQIITLCIVVGIWQAAVDDRPDDHSRLNGREADGLPRVPCNSRITSLWQPHFSRARQGPGRDPDKTTQLVERTECSSGAKCSSPGSDGEGGEDFCVAQRGADLLATFGGFFGSVYPMKPRHNARKGNSRTGRRLHRLRCGDWRSMYSLCLSSSS